MKRRILLLICLFMILSMCACRNESNTSHENSNINVVGAGDAYGDDDIAQHYEDQIQYYEGLCDNYGYQTYDEVYNPEKWKYYVDTETGIAHNDWLCDEYDHSHSGYLTTQLYSFDNIVECNKCSGTKIVFLDENTGVFHSEKRNLDLGTDDYISKHVNYRFVSIENALKHGYSYCNCCDFD